MGNTLIHLESPTSATGPRVWLGLLVVAWGAQAIVTQSLLLREALVLMFGSEFAWGIVLFAWLLGVALGALLGGWLAEREAVRRRPDVGLVVVLLLLSVAACVELWVFRGARAWLGIQPGELLPLPKTALAAMLFVSPASALVGMAFPFACCIGRVGWASPTSSERQVDYLTEEPRASAPADSRTVPTSPREHAEGGQCPPYLSFGHVYALESAGSLIGGAAFSFWAVEHLSPIQTALICGAATAIASAGLLAARQRRPYGAAGFALVGVAAVLLATLVGDAWNRRLVARRWHCIAPGYELVAETESKYQNLAVGRRAGQYTLYCDGQVSADFPDPYTFAPLAHFWMCQHPEPRTVLVLGGGAEGLLSEMLLHPIEHIDYVETDPRQIALIRSYLTEVDRDALNDPCVTVHHVDARYYVKTQRDRFDLVIARLPEPTSALRARFYTDEFYAELRQAMTPRSVLCMTATAAPGELPAISLEYLASIRATLKRHFPHLIVGWDNPAQLLAATAPRLISTDPNELARRYTQRGVESEMFHPVWFDGATDWLEPGKLARRAAELDALGDVPISTDMHPSIYIERLVLWEAATSGGVGPGRTETSVLARLRSVSVTHVAALLLLGYVLTVMLCRLRRRARDGWATGAVTLSVATTGFATMALSIVWLFAFQNLYGYVYQRIGWIIALFMAGLVMGCALGQRVGWALPTSPFDATRRSPDTNGGRCPPYLRASARVWRCLIGVDLLLAVLALAVPFVLPALGALPASPRVFLLVELCVSIMVVLTGVLGGATFALAGRLQLGATGRTGATAGSVVGADHAGACLGALLCGILLVPVLGTATAAFLLAGMKLASAAVLAVGRRFARAS
jgi:spermidine synthase